MMNIPCLFSSIISSNLMGQEFTRESNNAF
jgi:hypothetical protein